MRTGDLRNRWQRLSACHKHSGALNNNLKTKLGVVGGGSRAAKRRGRFWGNFRASGPSRCGGHTAHRRHLTHASGAPPVHRPATPSMSCGHSPVYSHRGKCSQDIPGGPGGQGPQAEDNGTEGFLPRVGQTPRSHLWPAGLCPATEDAVNGSNPPASASPQAEPHIKGGSGLKLIPNVTLITQLGSAGPGLGSRGEYVPLTPLQT